MTIKGTAGQDRMTVLGCRCNEVTLCVVSLPIRKNFPQRQKLIYFTTQQV